MKHSPEQAAVDPARRRIRRFKLGPIPDPAHRTLAAACGGDVRGQAFKAVEQLLRMLASFQANWGRAGLRFTYTPGDDRQARTQAALVFAAGQPRSLDVIERLGEGGPLRATHELARPEPLESWPLPDGLAACCEVVRREDRWESEARRRERNPYIPTLCYSIVPFEAREDNDWLAMDRLLDCMDSPVVVEVVVAPADIRHERTWHYRYVMELELASNQQTQGIWTSIRETATKARILGIYSSLRMQT